MAFRQLRPVMAFDEENHAEYVDAWWSKEAKGLPPPLLISLFARAVRALWERSHVTLGVVTLAAIVDRVLFVASENYPVLATLTVDERGVNFDEFRRAVIARHDDISEAALFMLVEFLTVLGHLTDEILTPALHEELAKVAREEAQNAGGDDKKRQKSREPRS